MRGWPAPAKVNFIGLWLGWKMLFAHTELRVAESLDHMLSNISRRRAWLEIESMWAIMKEVGQFESRWR